MLLIFLVMLCTFQNWAQHPITVTLNSLLEIGDYSEAEKDLDQFSVRELANLPDSVLLDYYYLKAAIYSHKGDEKSKRVYLTAAKDLSEESQGVHTPAYMEICWALGKSYEDSGELLPAFEIFQAALIEGIGRYSLEDEDVEHYYNYMEKPRGFDPFGHARLTLLGKIS